MSARLPGGSYTFLGGDEVQSGCWATDANVSTWLKAHGLTAAELQAYYEQQLIGIVRGEMKKEVQYTRLLFPPFIMYPWQPVPCL